MLCAVKSHFFVVVVCFFNKMQYTEARKTSCYTEGTGKSKHSNLLNEVPYIFFIYSWSCYRIGVPQLTNGLAEIYLKEIEVTQSQKLSRNNCRNVKSIN